MALSAAVYAEPRIQQYFGDSHRLQPRHPKMEGTVSDRRPEQILPGTPQVDRHEEAGQIKNSCERVSLFASTP
jgi:hypothetical protein